MVLLQLSRVLKTKMVEIVTRALNKLMMLAKINAKCAMEVFYTSLHFLIHINCEGHTWGGESL